MKDTSALNSMGAIMLFCRMVLTDNKIPEMRGMMPDVEIDWEQIYQLSINQHISAIVFDGIQRSQIELPRGLRIKWSGNWIETQRRYALHENVIEKLAGLMATYGIKILILKGYGRSLDYPVPNHRAVGDIDIFLFREEEGGWRCCREEGNRLISEAYGVAIDQGHEHHDRCEVEGVLIENHYDFVNRRYLRSGGVVEEELKKLWDKGIKTVYTKGGRPVYLPSADFDALFLSYHLARHFTSSNINLRQIIDWGLLVAKHGESVDWGRMKQMWERVGMTNFMDQIGIICSHELGLHYPAIIAQDGTTRLSDRIVKEMELESIVGEDHPKTIVRLAQKMRRFLRHRWRRKIAQRESTIESFVSIGLTHIRERRV